MDEMTVEEQIDVRGARCVDLIGKLGPGERRILHMLYKGYSKKQIAQNLGRSTWHSLLTPVYKKLGVHTQEEAIRIYNDALDYSTRYVQVVDKDPPRTPSTAIF
jgi:DNA-binding CsgD family transcriptional regulator